MSDSLPDLRPVPFGSKQHWLAIRGGEPREVASALGVVDPRPTTWREGIARTCGVAQAMKRRKWQKRADLFVSPAVRGWTLVVGAVGAIPPAGMPGWLPLMIQLGSRFGQAQYFGTQSDSGYMAWGMAEGGRVVRAYAVAREVLVEIGEPTAEEVAIGFDFLDESKATDEALMAHQAKVDAERVRIDAISRELAADPMARGSDDPDDPRFDSRLPLLIPSEESVMLLADRWSVDPSRLDRFDADPGPGLLGSVPIQKR